MSDADIGAQPGDPAPFAHGSVFVTLNLHWGLAPSEAFARLRRQARLAAAGGFDGVCLSEHHGDFPGYLPVPLQSVGILLGDMPRGWAAPNPTIVAFRSLAAIVEDAAWLHAAFPGRLGLAFAAGAVPAEFAGFGIPRDERARRFREITVDVAETLGGRGPNEMLRADPAVREAVGRIPLALSVGGERHIRLAAQIGAALTPATIVDPERIRAAFRIYQDAGGSGARIVQRWLHVGGRPDDAIDAYHSGHGEHTGNAFDVGPFADPDPTRVAEHVVDWVRTVDATAVAVRFHLGPLGPDAVDEQITRFGTEVLPQIRAGIAPAP
jgi:alkanesulfonate monooxygenase SsuD/methylene tetrahydromethanopterin reductase-like flavin-dependent oxidoreductase (luciferase family)